MSASNNLTALKRDVRNLCKALILRQNLPSIIVMK